MMEALEIDATQPKKILWNWQETKKKKKLGPRGGYFATQMVEEEVCRV
jgi:hypothetical protein